MNTKGVFVVVEGNAECCGKSTVVKKIADMLVRVLGDDNVVVVRQPGGTPEAEQIRSVLKNPKNDLSTDVEYLLFSAARKDLDEKVIAPALKAGKVVITDRHVPTTHVYQGKEIKAIDNIVARQADINVFVNTPIAICKSRRAVRNEQCRFEVRDDSFHGAMSKRYQKYMERVAPLPYEIEGIASMEYENTLDVITHTIVDMYAKDEGGRIITLGRYGKPDKTTSDEVLAKFNEKLLSNTIYGEHVAAVNAAIQMQKTVDGQLEQFKQVRLNEVTHQVLKATKTDVTVKMIDPPEGFNPDEWGLGIRGFHTNGEWSDIITFDLCKKG